MTRIALLALTVALAVAAGCGTTTPGGMSGPTMNNRLNAQADDDAPGIQSNDILAREAAGTHTTVKHILVSWDERGEAFNGHQDPRGRKRARKEADDLAVKLLTRVRDGEDMDALMKEYSEDPGSAASGKTYDVKPDANLVFEFRRMGLRLKVGETGLVLTKFGWHVMKRVE